jgi:hypothetical protein
VRILCGQGKFESVGHVLHGGQRPRGSVCGATGLRALCPGRTDIERRSSSPPAQGVVTVTCRAARLARDRTATVPLRRDAIIALRRSMPRDVDRSCRLSTGDSRSRAAGTRARRCAGPVSLSPLARLPGRRRSRVRCGQRCRAYPRAQPPNNREERRVREPARSRQPQRRRPGASRWSRQRLRWEGYFVRCSCNYARTRRYAGQSARVCIRYWSMGQVIALGLSCADNSRHGGGRTGPAEGRRGCAQSA